MSRLTKALSAALLLSTAWGAGAAPSVYLLLRANGNDIRGDSKVMTLGREDSIECLAFQSGVTSARSCSVADLNHADPITNQPRRGCRGDPLTIPRTSRA